jgi:2-isopropylmalate synthase/UPF0716 protein FxsA
LNYFLIYLLIEVFVSVNISSSIGAMYTFLEIILSAVVGFMLLANFRVNLIESMQALQRNAITMQEFQKLNAFALLGAILLIIPGFFSDIVGIFLQFSFFATLFAKKVLHVKDKKDNIDINNTYIRRDDDEIIDVEVIDDSSPK